MFGSLQHSPSSAARSVRRRSDTRRSPLPVIRAQSSRHTDAHVTGPKPELSRRQLLALSAPLALLLGGLPAGVVTAWPPAARAAGPVLPSAEVKKALDKALSRTITKQKAAVALRLVFHDAGTFNAASGDGGPNASIQYEMDRPENFGLKRGWKLIQQLREDIQKTPADAVVSDADLVALAGAHAVRVCGGPAIPVPIGRPVATAADPPGRMPGENFSAAELKANFASKGLSVQEMVALSGAHTIGSKGYGDPVTFDNEYYRALLRRPWLNPNDSMASMIGLPSDHVLPDDPDCLPHIQRYAEDQDAFFADFSAAYVKMTSLGVPGWA